jgi:restriction system protein
MLAGAALLGWTALEWAWHLVSSHALAFGLAASMLVLLAIGAAILAARAAHREQVRRAELERNIAVTDAMSGPAFEQYVARLMRRSGFRRVQVCGGSGDRGADVIAYTGDGRRVVVQCKRYTGAVGDPHLQRFNGTVWSIHHADVALFVTTGRPTAKARELAEMVGIILVDRHALAIWAADAIPPIPGWPRPRPVAVAGTHDLPLTPETP